LFKQVTSATCVLVGPPEFVDGMHGIMLCMRRHLDNWEKNLELARWEETASCLRTVLKLVEAEISERKPAPVATIQINDL
jgi:hypothetical protein